MPANIGPQERAKRRTAGVVTLVAAVAIAGVMIGFHAARPWRLALAVPFYVAMLGFFQAREKT